MSPSFKKRMLRVWWRMPGDVGGDEKFSLTGVGFAQADDDGWTEAGGDDLVGLLSEVRTPRAKAPVRRLTGVTDGDFEEAWASPASWWRLSGSAR